MVNEPLPKAVQDCHQCLLWMIPQLDQFPRNRRFTLGERLESALLEVLELLTEATYSRNNHQLLQRANSRLAVARHLWRLAYELQVIANKIYAFGSNLIQQIGRQVGGWQKAARS